MSTVVTWLYCIGGDHRKADQGYVVAGQNPWTRLGPWSIGSTPLCLPLSLCLCIYAACGAIYMCVICLCFTWIITKFLEYWQWPLLLPLSVFSTVTSYQHLFQTVNVSDHLTRGQRYTVYVQSLTRNTEQWQIFHHYNCAYIPQAVANALPEVRSSTRFKASEAGRMKSEYTLCSQLKRATPILFLSSNLHYITVRQNWAEST